ncbi:MAG: DUF934 domain-containing protein [Porticoccaceae bacterium]|nr:DUF934 domain-containing protein [Porticoccaceae bacterium]
MPKLLNKGALVEDTWQRLGEEFSDDIGDAPDGKVLFPLAYWLEHREGLLNHPNSGLWLNSDDEPELLSEIIPKLSCIAVNFSAFTDGRGFSLARLVRERYDYQGELRAIGSFLTDQLYYLKRCGFDTFELADNVELDTALKCSDSFSVQYQATGSSF